MGAGKNKIKTDVTSTTSGGIMQTERGILSHQARNGEVRMLSFEFQPMVRPPLTIAWLFVRIIGGITGAMTGDVWEL